MLQRNISNELTPKQVCAVNNVTLRFIKDRYTGFVNTSLLVGNSAQLCIRTVTFCAFNIYVSNIKTFMINSECKNN